MLDCRPVDTHVDLIVKLVQSQGSLYEIHGDIDDL